MNQAEFDQLTEQSKNTISAKVICDSLAPNNCRLTTMEWTYPRFIHAEIMTHRKLSRNSASSRAIPLAKMIERVQTNPVFPLHWGKNQKGMQAAEELSTEAKLIEGQRWIDDRDHMIDSAQRSAQNELHKQIGNRKLETWMWITVVVSATNFENLFGLRCHPAAEPHFQNLAYKVRSAYDESTPTRLNWGDWHLPYFTINSGGGDADLCYIEYEVQKGWFKGNKWTLAAQLSAARCGRVSYLTHDQRRDCIQDRELYERLASGVPLHASPLEHPAQAIEPDLNGNYSYPKTNYGTVYSHDWGNYDEGWLQFRKMHENENITKRV